MSKTPILIKNLLSPPIFQDEEQTRLARVVHVLYFAITLASLIVLIADGARVSTTIIILAINFLLLFASWLNLQGHPRRAGLVMLILLLTGISALLLIGNGIHDIAITTLPVLLIMSALILDRKGVLLFAALVVGATGFVVYAEISRLPWFNINPPSYTSISDFFIVASILAIAAISSHLLIEQLVASLTHAKLSEARMLSLVENSPDSILEINRTGQIIYINRFAETYLGKNVREILPADQVDYALEVIESAFINGEPQAIELQTIAPDGRVSWDSIRVGPVKSGNQTTSLTIIMTEITAQKNAEAALKENEERYRSAITSAGLVPYVIDYPRKSFTFISEDIYKLTGYKAKEFTPAILKAIVLENYVWGPNAQLTLEEARQRFRSGEITEWHSDMLIRTRSGESRWVSDSSIELKDETGKARGAIGIFGDITERKLFESEREKLFRELAAKNAELERFNYTVSHELRSPIVTIKGFVGSVEKDLQNENIEKARKDLSRIANAADKMQETLSDLLDLSRIGRIINSPERVDLSQLIPEVLENLDGHIQKHNVRIHISPDLPTIYADRTRLREVFENLIGNATKYMGNQKNPLIEIGAHQENGEQIISIKDNGIGIDAQYRTKIFGLFEKLNPASEGTGIGLALIKRIIEIHGGKIWVESEGLGKGSTFCFTIPNGKEQTSIL